MKNVVHPLKILILIYFGLFCQVDTNAAFWADQFEESASDDWQHIGGDSVWRVEDGFLRVEVQTQQEWHLIFERYQFIAYPGPYNDFTITLETIGATGARFGIALAKHFRNPVTEVEEYGYYLFFTDDMQAAREGGVFVGPQRRWNTEELQQMELHFKDGRFQLQADGESRLDFIDANFDAIHSIAIVLAGYVTEDVAVGSAWVDTFMVDGLAVSPKRKLTTTWAGLKRNSTDP